MLNTAGHLPSTIVIAPHNGACNGSSQDFVRLAHPTNVIFPAGHDHRHPTTRSADLYPQTVAVSNIYRTDHGDKSAGEWSRGRRAGCVDEFDDDNIQNQLRGNGTCRVYYMTGDGD